MGKECLEFGMQFNAVQIQTMTKSAIFHFVALFVSVWLNGLVCYGIVWYRQQQ